MEEAATATTAGGGGEESNGDMGESSSIDSCWVSSTNWTVRHGSLRDSICLESSSSILESGDDDVSVASDLILSVPAGADPDPCEITVCFRKKHEIHRVYVRSTARVYEIYYAPEEQSKNNEYLCTVRCGASAKEVLLSSYTTGETDTNQLTDSHAPSEQVPEEMVKSISNSSSDEDGWVEVKVPESPLFNNENKSLSKKENVGADMQICYEATAEISDASPFISLTLRLISLQTKGCIHVEEIYIYADPVASIDSNPPVSSSEKLVGNPLLTMLVPGLLQLSKAGASRIREQDVSDNSALEKNNFGAAKASQVWKSETVKTVMQVQDTFSILADQGKGQVSAPSGIQTVNTNLSSDVEVPGPAQVPRPISEENIAYSRLGESLDELVSRVGRLETFFLRFEEKMLKPLSCIEIRLQRLEQQLDTLTVRTASSEPLQCSRIYAPEFSCDESASDEGSDPSDIIRQVATVDSPSVVEDVTVCSPDVIKEDTTVDCPGIVEEDATVCSPYVIKEDTTFDSPGRAEEDATADSPYFPANETSTRLAFEMCPGLIVTAPDFLTEDDEYCSSNDISDSAGKYSKGKVSNDLSDSAGKDCSKEKVSFSIDSALISALEAFLLSTSAKSLKTSVEAPDLLTEVDHNSCVGETAGRFPSEEAGVFGTVSRKLNRECNLKVDSITCIASPAGSKEQVSAHQAWCQGLSVEESAEEVFSSSKYQVSSDVAIKEGSDAASDKPDDHDRFPRRWIDDSDTEEAADQVLNLNMICKKWNKNTDTESSVDESINSDTESSVDESITTNHYFVDSVDGSSTDPVKESFSLHNWLYGHQNDPRFKETMGMGTMRLGHFTKGIGDESLHHSHGESKVEIERALNPMPISDVQFALHGTLNVGSSLEALPEKMMGNKFHVSGFNDGSGIMSGRGVRAIDNFPADLWDLSVGTNASGFEGSSNPEIVTRKDCCYDENTDSIIAEHLDNSLQDGECPDVESLLIDLRDLAVISKNSSLEGSSNLELMDTKVDATNFNDVGDIIIGREDNSFSLQGMEHAVVTDNFLVDLQDLAVESNASSLKESSNLENITTTKVQVPKINDDGIIIGGIIVGQQDSPFPLQSEEHLTAADDFLVDLWEIALEGNTGGMEGSSNQQPFSSLI